MTVGQRIAQKRKELGLSQEGLGARLGVSRQAIYKWESDAALPEIEKLVNLSREFSVSIDWLLGQEDESREPRELTAEQLRMVEEIVGRYLAARPGTEPSGGDEPSKDEGPERPKKRRRWPLVLAGLAAVVLIGVFSNLFSRLDRLYNDTQNLQMNVGEIRYDVNSQIYGITQRVEDILQRQNALTAEQSAEVTGTDYRTNTVTVSARAVPRTFVEGMTAEFILVSGGETVTVPGELGDDHAFTAQITGPLSDNIAVSAVLLIGDQRQTQLLNQFDGLYSSSFPELTVNGGLWGFHPEVRGDADVLVGADAAARITSLRLGLFRDKKLLAWYEQAEPPANSQGDWQFFRLDGEWVMEPEHVYCVAAVVTDEYGRERVYQDFPVMYDPESEYVDYYAPDNVLTEDPNPANWEY